MKSGQISEHKLNPSASNRKTEVMKNSGKSSGIPALRRPCAIAVAAWLFIVPMTAWAAGPVFPQSMATEADVVYAAIITRVFGNSFTGVYTEPDTNSKMMATLNPGTPIQIFSVMPDFVGIRLGGDVGYVLRHRISDAVAIDPVSTPRFGTALNRYFATLDRDTAVRDAPDPGAEVLITLGAGTHLGFLDLSDGWARLIFKRQYGYVDTNSLPALRMVSATADAATGDIPLAVYNSFYNIATDKLNLNRINNLIVGSARMDRVMQPGETLDFNGTVGPFRASNGYLEAYALLDGEFSPTYGGGSCQISSTLYNVVLQLTGLTVLQRSPHGASGVAYLPHGVDASSGALNFRFRNDYVFPVRIASHVQDGSLFIAVYREDLL